MTAIALPELREKDVARQCDDLVRKMGGTVVRTNPPHRVKQDYGLPDRRYRMMGTAFFFELKRPQKTSLLSAHQYGFLTAELDHGCLAACGILDDLVLVINAIRGGKSRDGAIEECRRIVERWKAKGFRRT